MKQPFCNRLFAFSIFARLQYATSVNYRPHYRGFTASTVMLPRYYRQCYPNPTVTTVFVTMFNPITMVLLRLPRYYRHPRPHAAL